ncbi:dihydrofolate reductase [Blattabacterium cuenoti]|uniref:dihydrofolate reductase n=1 Tax=Blattabacterium cuenoti TaxID=1653831 RepID=UPI00163CF302|nr:dihydrofolate reductase [Blattabacterium cuenoti]
MRIIIIASVSKNRFIGKNNKLMWHLPNDLKRFKTLTVGETIIMGRKTFDSIGKILPNRENIILTKNTIGFLKKKIKTISSIKEIMDFTYDRIFIIGGEKLYRSMIDKADIIELTLVHKKFHGDAKFPIINRKNWIKVHEFFYEKDEDHLYNYSFIRFERKNN